MAGLHGKVALITGAGGRQGVGRATALKLAALGADIALTDIQRRGGSARIGSALSHGGV
jgi:NAD(P)-dependent dehydrogenase (short-subunit alcohol dehydrogenase family)